MKIDRPIAIAVILFIILILGFYLVGPKYKEFKDLQTKLSKKEAEFKGKESYFSAIVDTFGKLKKHEEELEKINSALPSDSSLAQLVYFLQTKSSEDGLILQNGSLLGVSPSTSKNNIKEIRLSLNLFGSYSAFKNFLGSLEKSARLIEIESISFSSQKKTEEIYSFNMMIKTRSY